MKSIGNYESLPTSNDEDTVPDLVVQTPSSRSLLSSLKQTTQRIQPLVIPYMAPLFLVYVSEYTINQVLQYTCWLTVGCGTDSFVSLERYAFQVYSRRISNLPNTLPIRRFHLTFLRHIHQNSQHISSLHSTILYPVLSNNAISLCDNPLDIPLIHHNIL
jgi:hypothetical protein